MTFLITGPNLSPSCSQSSDIPDYRTRSQCILFSDLAFLITGPDHKSGLFTVIWYSWLQDLITVHLVHSHLAFLITGPNLSPSCSLSSGIPDYRVHLVHSNLAFLITGPEPIHHPPVIHYRPQAAFQQSSKSSQHTLETPWAIWHQKYPSRLPISGSTASRESSVTGMGLPTRYSINTTTCAGPAAMDPLITLKS